jgi:soluble lytic murein transglycosylase-like protein
MEGLGPRWLILLAVTAAVATATSAGADVRKKAAQDGTSYFTSPRPRPSYQPSYQRAVFTSATPRRAHEALPHGVYSREIAEASARYAVPERLIWAVIRVESGFDYRAVSPKGARGLMQLMPETAALLGVQDSFDARENIQAGTRHLRALLERFRHDVRLSLAAYNAGEKAVVAFGGVPPYPETRDYVIRVLRFYNAPIHWGVSPGGGIHRIVEPDGTIMYTNIPFGRSSASSPGR